MFVFQNARRHCRLHFAREKCWLPVSIPERLENVAKTIGDPHRVMAGSDCGFETIAGRGRVAEDVVWAKFKSIAEGAKLASSRLF